MGNSLADFDSMDFGDLDGFFDVAILKELGIAGASGTAAALLGTYAIQKMAAMDMFKDWKPLDRSRVLSGVAIAAGVLAGRGLYQYNRDAAMGVAGGLAGLGLASLIGTFFETRLVPVLGEVEDESMLLADYDYEAMNGLHGDDDEAGDLGETAVQASAPAFRGLHGPTVTQEQLQGAVVQQETLGAYMPYLS